MARPAKGIASAALRYLQALEENGIRIKAAYLYGSRVRGDHRPDSDIDVAVVCTGLSKNIVHRTRQLWRPRLNIDTRIEPVGFSPEDFRDENPLAWEIKRHGIRIK